MTETSRSSSLGRSFWLGGSRTKSRRRTPDAESNTYGLPRGEALRKELASVFREQRHRVLSFLRTGRKDHAGGEDGLPHAFPNWNDFRLGALKMSERMTPLLELIWDQAAGKFAPRVGLDPNAWSVINPNTERMIDAAALAFCDSTNETTSLELGEALTRMKEELRLGVVEQGESLFYLTKRVNKIFDRAETWRARRIAQTETSRAVHAAQEQSAIASGVVTGWTWLLSSDACPLCQTIARRASAVRLGQPFAVVGSNPTYSQVRFPPAHPHCNCTVNEVLDYDPQPVWADTLHQPEPEPEDYPESTPKPEISAKPRKPKPPAAPRKPKPVGPRGTPVSDALDLQLTTPRVGRAVENALATIDKVHGDGKLPSIPVVELTKGVNAGHLNVLKGKPFEIGIHRSGETPRLTTAHEIGHFLDWSGIDAKYRGSLGQIDQRKDPRFNGFLEAVDRSVAIQSLKALRYKDSVTVVRGAITSTCKVDKKYVDYLLQDHEVWARAYSQYIATKSEDPDMMAELAHINRFGEERTYKEQWSHDDFKPIAVEIDKLFRGIGWLK